MKTTIHTYWQESPINLTKSLKHRQNMETVSNQEASSCMRSQSWQSHQRAAPMMSIRAISRDFDHEVVILRVWSCSLMKNKHNILRKGRGGGGTRHFLHKSGNFLQVCVVLSSCFGQSFKSPDTYDNVVLMCQNIKYLVIWETKA